ncbi:MAG: hypothetical protein NTW08_02075 [Gammaproteobacteria bacterium]|nr:hypothetical protein [Gammaproteobacteria bacterium]
MWSPESALILHLNKSKQYQRVLICIYAGTVWVLLFSACGVVFKVAGCVFLVMHGVKLIREGIPTDSAMCLTYAAGQWTLTQQHPDKASRHPERSEGSPTDKNEIKLEQVKLLVHTDLLILLRFFPANSRPKTMVIFRDQLTDAQLRRLMWIVYSL